MDIQTDLAAVQERIAQIAGAAFVPDAASPQFAGVLNGLISDPHPGGQMQVPVEGTITSGFGPRPNPLGSGSEFHPGIDIAADEGTPIQAAAPGRIVQAGPDGGYGNLIVVDDGNGVTTRYGHCSRMYARIGQLVAAGQTIGEVGSTGRSTGPHLHFEVRVGDTPVDPAHYLPISIPKS